MQGKRINIEGYVASDEGLLGGGILSLGANGGLGTRRANRVKPGREGDRLANRVVDGNTHEMLALAEAFDEMLQSFGVGAGWNAFNRFLHVFGASGSLGSEVAEQVPAVGADLISGVERRNTNDTYGKGQNELESRAHSQSQ